MSIEVADLTEAQHCTDRAYANLQRLIREYCAIDGIVPWPLKLSASTAVMAAAHAGYLEGVLRERGTLNG